MQSQLSVILAQSKARTVSVDSLHEPFSVVPK